MYFITFYHVTPVNIFFGPLCTYLSFVLLFFSSTHNKYTKVFRSVCELLCLQMKLHDFHTCKPLLFFFSSIIPHPFAPLYTLLCKTFHINMLKKHTHTYADRNTHVNTYAHDSRCCRSKVSLIFVSERTSPLKPRQENHILGKESRISLFFCLAPSLILFFLLYFFNVSQACKKNK